MQVNGRDHSYAARDQCTITIVPKKLATLRWVWPTVNGSRPSGLYFTVKKCVVLTQSACGKCAFFLIYNYLPQYSHLGESLLL